MIKKYIIVLFCFFFTSNLLGKGYDVVGIGIYDIKFDGSATNTATDFRFEPKIISSEVTE